MMKFRNVVTAFLSNNDEFLLMHRSMNNKRMPGFWYGVGGHVEKEELNNPFAACMREIYEETGIQEHEIDNLKLKYILMRSSNNETVINYVYFGQTQKKDVIENEEGSLHWIDKSEVLNHKFFDAIQLCLEHYLSENKDREEVLVGLIYKEDSVSKIKFSLLEDMDKK